MENKYTGSVYIGVAGPETGPITCFVSIVNINKRDGDEGPLFASATKGYEVRQNHINDFMESEHDFILLLDHDMLFEPDTLERLRSHEKPYVSGYYLRRQHAPMYSVWYQQFNGDWPHSIYLEDPERGKLHKIGASGWGCVLIHRDVIEATREILKGEQEVLEDDMDVWPYDLGAVMRGEEKIRPLRVVKDSVIGSDIRYPFYAKEAGFQLYGDPDVRPHHMISYPLSADDYAGQSIASQTNMRAARNNTVIESREAIEAAYDELTIGGGVLL